MLFKNILLGLGGTAVVGGGGYMIYNATKSGDENQTEGANQEGGETQTTQPQQSSELGGTSSPSGSSDSGNGAGSKK